MISFIADKKELKRLSFRTDTQQVNFVKHSFKELAEISIAWGCFTAVNGSALRVSRFLTAFYKFKSILLFVLAFATVLWCLKLSFKVHFFRKLQISQKIKLLKGFNSFQRLYLVWTYFCSFRNRIPSNSPNDCQTTLFFFELSKANFEIDFSYRISKSFQ